VRYGASRVPGFASDPCGDATRSHGALLGDAGVGGHDLGDQLAGPDGSELKPKPEATSAPAARRETSTIPTARVRRQAPLPISRRTGTIADM